VGDKGGIRLEPFGFYQSVGDLDLDTSVDLGAFARRTHDLCAETESGVSPQQHWVRALQGRVDLLPTAELALNTMLISEAIYLSDQLEREVTQATKSCRAPKVRRFLPEGDINAQPNYLDVVL
jgi:predicted dehydrogenase